MTDPQPSQQEIIRALASHVGERLRRGESPDTIRADLIARGLVPDMADALLEGFAPGKWQQGVRGWALCIIGVAVVLAGVFLFIGNRSGEFSTFPFAGTLVTLIGVGLFVFGRGK